MKAMILAAGFGTRLAPYTDHTPKPLFTLGGRPLLDMIIRQLETTDCEAVMINTHHHHKRIQAFLDSRTYSIPVLTRYEDTILGTGGGIRNIADFWSSGTLLVINADIVCRLDLNAVAATHHSHQQPVTMVMHDYPRFNSVWVDPQGDIVSFDQAPDKIDGCQKMAFTGIHIIERIVLDCLPQEGFASIIDAYRNLLAAGHRIKTHRLDDVYWCDIGTPSSYQNAVFDHLAPQAFEKAYGRTFHAQAIQRQPLIGDGSDRRWFRLQAEDKTLIMVDHGIRPDLSRQEVDAFVAIGTHLQSMGVPVPPIFGYDCFAGLVFMEDLGNQHLQQRVEYENPATRYFYYGQVIDEWIKMAVRGAQEFDPAWTFQSTHYDRDLILEKECRYFTEAFLHGYLNRRENFKFLQAEFEQLADGIEKTAIMGLIHRDFQSRNIMLKNEAIRIIDFQGARLGPIQYDLASLLIDPYVALSKEEQHRLLDETVLKLEQQCDLDAERFIAGFRLCAVTRNLQILGAFAFLSKSKGKEKFKAYIPRAVINLHRNLAAQPLKLPRLVDIIAEIQNDQNIH
jgi:aminoglycoside/choline kinase family phosphotransferase/GTP:adenosylcobinamide-phosphate guanylyltransferase